MRKRHFYWMMFTIIIGILSCNPLDCNITGDCDEPMSGERIDLHMNGHLDLSYHLEVGEQESIVDHITPPFPAYEYSFVLKLADDREMKITITHKHLPNSWLYPSITYDVFPTSILDNKFKYVQAELIGKTGSAHYVSHTPDHFPMDITLGAFHVVDVNDDWLRGRIHQLKLHQLEDSDNWIVVNGTFVSSLPKLLY